MDRAVTAITVMQIRQIISPGKIPAANSPPIETPISDPYTTIKPDGGMVGPMIDPAAVTAQA